MHSEVDRLPDLKAAFDGGLVLLNNVCWQEEGHDPAQYAVLAAVILAIATGTIRLIGSQAGSVFANVGSSIQ